MRRSAAAVVLAALLAGGCVTMGRDFPAEPVASIANGKTTKADLRGAFGEPFQTGIEDGLETWTWYLIKYRGSRKATSKELHVTFDQNGLVKTYSFTSTRPPR